MDKRGALKEYTMCIYETFTWNTLVPLMNTKKQTKKLGMVACAWKKRKEKKSKLATQLPWSLEAGVEFTSHKSSHTPQCESPESSLSLDTSSSQQGGEDARLLPSGWKSRVPSSPLLIPWRAEEDLLLSSGTESPRFYPVWWQTPGFPALGNLKQGHCEWKANVEPQREFPASLGYIHSKNLSLNRSKQTTKSPRFLFGGLVCLITTSPKWTSWLSTWTPLSWVSVGVTVYLWHLASIQQLWSKCILFG
jgi:hypothetical protein